jgi:hypothetical protein
VTYLSLTSILDVSILLEEVKMFCFASKSAWVIVEPVEFAIFVPISTPSIKNVLQLICAGTNVPIEKVSLATIKELIFKYEFLVNKFCFKS